MNVLYCSLFIADFFGFCFLIIGLVMCAEDFPKDECDAYLKYSLKLLAAGVAGTIFAFAQHNIFLTSSVFISSLFSLYAPDLFRLYRFLKKPAQVL